MRFKVKVNYPDNFPCDDNYMIIETDNNLNELDISKICLDSALDMIFDTGITWDYEEIN